jgi:hypothetical protein
MPTLLWSNPSLRDRQTLFKSASLLEHQQKNTLHSAKTAIVEANSVSLTRLVDGHPLNAKHKL